MHGADDLRAALGRALAQRKEQDLSLAALPSAASVVLVAAMAGAMPAQEEDDAPRPAWRMTAGPPEPAHSM